MSQPPLRARRLALALVASLGLLVGACSSERPELAEERESTTTSTTEATTTTEAAPAAQRAQATGDVVDLYASADAPEPDRQLTKAEAVSDPAIPIVFLVKDEADDRYEVYLPVRPNGSTAWVDKDAVEVAAVEHRIEVEIAAHRIRVYEDDELLVDEPVGVGRDDRPTPGGIYYIKELLQPPNPNGPYGVYAYGLNGFSDVLTSFNGGQGVLGIHGTNEPDKLGQDVSSGCIRLHNDVIDRLVNEIGLPLGTPVEVIA
ncbi:MAG: L,D-transpeptidase [Actinomycetota bacterium]